MYFDSSDVPGGKVVDYTVYAYNSTIATENLIDSASSTKTVPNWDDSEY